LSAISVGTTRRAESRRRLLWHLIVHEVRREQAGTVLGVAWVVLQPLLMLGAYFFLFTVLRIAKHAPHGALGQVAIILSGIVVWWYFIRSFSHGLSILDSHAALVKQINFPVGTLPFVTVGTELIDFVIGMVMLLALVSWQGWVSWTALMLIPASLLLTIFLVGLAALIAPLGAMLRDIRNIVPLIVRLGLWISPVLYLPGTIPVRFHWVMYANPMTYFIGLVRWAALGPSFGSHRVTLVGVLPTLGIATGIALVFAAAGSWAWTRYVRRVAVDYL
jgi:lipopolysaccharide transport system permease protein